MKSTGIVRKVDELGRIAFSANMRRAAYSVEIRRKSSNTRVSEYAGIV